MKQIWRCYAACSSGMVSQNMIFSVSLWTWIITGTSCKWIHFSDTLTHAWCIVLEMKDCNVQIFYKQKDSPIVGYFESGEKGHHSKTFVWREILKRTEWRLRSIAFESWKVQTKLSCSHKNTKLNAFPYHYMKKDQRALAQHIGDCCRPGFRAAI